MTNRKGQSSVELLVLLSVALVIFIVVGFVSQEQTIGVLKQKDELDAKNTVEDLRFAAIEVYSQGEGARKKVYVKIPKSYDPSKSYVQDDFIKLNVLGTDFVGVTDFDLHGNLPTTSGLHWVWVISEGNRVRIGNAMVRTDKTSIYKIMNQNNSASDSFNVINIWDKNISVTLSKIWSHDNVTLDISQTSFALEVGEQKTVSLSFNTNSNAIGFYSGDVEITGVEGNNSETIKLPITVEVTTAPINADPFLTVTPNFWGGEFDPGDNSSKVFTICTNGVSVTSVDFNPSSGSPGDWIGNTSSLGAISNGNCEQKTLNVSVPILTTPGTYQGNIDVIGQGAENAQANITLYYVIPESIQSCQNETGACNCPVGSNYWGVPTCNCQQGTVYVINNTIFGGPDNGLPYTGTLRGGPGEDVIVGTNGTDIILTDEGNDRVCGLEGDDQIYGENGNDILDGNEGNDYIDGGQGNDEIYGKDGDDTIIGDQGNDEIDGGDGNDVINGGGGTETVYGGAGNDEINGGNGDDILCGNSGNDIINGEINSDTIDGGTGTDTVNGGTGSDTCYNSEGETSCETTPSGYYNDCGPT